MYEYLSSKYDLIGIDFDRDVVQGWAELKAQNTVRADAHNVPIADDSIDIVFTRGLFEPGMYGCSPSKILGEIRRVLRPEGIFIPFETYAYECPEVIQQQFDPLNSVIYT